MQVAVVGAGILGLAIARRLQESAPGVEITVLDKEDRVAAHQTSHNSGVAHAGVYYPQGSLKAELCRRGIGLLKDYCTRHSVAYDECGKLIVARDASELTRLDEIERRARGNGVPGLHRPGGLVLRSPRGEELGFAPAALCAGLHADRLARMAGEREGPAIVPFRGEYYRPRPHRTALVRGLIYPVPDAAYPFLGVHFTRRVDGGVEIGPNAILALAREGYRPRDVSPRDLAGMLAWPGFRRLARRHWRTGAWKLHGSLSRREFVARARSFIPELRTDDVEPAPAGVRAQAVDRDGTLVDDFRIGRVGGIVTIRNAPSPAATSSLAIAEYVCTRMMS
jgi:L-2-hydroxyglutarate oxidase LhgO